MVSLISRPKPKLISALAAFGAGALIAALTVELVAPTVFALHEETGNLHHGEPITAFIALFIGAVIGGLLFVLLDQLVNAHGGFLRKASTVIAYFRIAERNRQKKLVEKLSQYPLLQPILTQHVNTLLSMVRPINFSKGNEIAKEGEDADMVFFVIKGTLNHTWLILAEGLAAGAMLTMIASAMIPEAVHMGSASAVGLSTLAGFLAAISFKLLE